MSTVYFVIDMTRFLAGLLTGLAGVVMIVMVFYPRLRTRENTVHAARFAVVWASVYVATSLVAAWQDR